MGYGIEFPEGCQQNTIIISLGYIKYLLNIEAEELMALDFKGSPVRVIIKDGEPWWVAKEACDILGLTVRDSVRYLDEDEKGYVLRKHLGLSPGKDMAIVNEQ
jgi:prophage antirepressor-like protein